MAEINLLLFDAAASAGLTAETVFGGLPSVDADFVWPRCAACAGSMQFLGQLRVPGEDRLLLVFMCANDPGMCDEWNSDAGGNAVLCAGIERLSLATEPETGRAVRPTRYGARLDRIDAEDYDAARALWTAGRDGQGREVLGQIGGAPGWLQGDETPDCPMCHERMRFVAQLEPGPDAATEMNFGGGCGYVFSCARHPEDAAFLWQN